MIFSTKKERSPDLSPNEKFLNAIKPSLKRQVAVDAFGGN